MISNRIRKNMPPAFRLGPELATLNPGGGLRQAWFRWMAQCMGYLLVACRGPAVKSRGRGRVSCTDTLLSVRLVNLSAK